MTTSITFMPPLAIVPPTPKESIRTWRKSFETATAVFSEEQAIALLPAYCNRNEAERTAAKEVAKKFVKGKLKEALDALVEIIDGPARPHEDAELFFKYEMSANGSIFEAMYALRALANKANIESRQIIAQKFLSVLPNDVRTAVLKDADGKQYLELELDELLAIARREASLRTPYAHSEQRLYNAVQVAEEVTPESGSVDDSQSPRWFETAMSGMVQRLERLESTYNGERVRFQGSPQRRQREHADNHRPVKCRNCRSTGHVVRRCPQRFCQACGKSGHDSWMTECPNKDL